VAVAVVRLVKVAVVVQEDTELLLELLEQTLLQHLS
jgi:hypothetical protein